MRHIELEPGLEKFSYRELQVCLLLLVVDVHVHWLSRSELASFPGYQKMSKYIIEVVHAGISSLKINVKGRKGMKNRHSLITYRHTCIIVIHLGARPQSVTVAKPYQTVRTDESIFAGCYSTVLCNRTVWTDESFHFTGHITGDSAHNLIVKLSPCMCSHNSCHGWRNDSLAYVIATYTL